MEDDVDSDVGPSLSTSSVQSMLERMLDLQATHGEMMQSFLTTQAAHG